MKNQLSDYCKNCKKYCNSCEGSACSCENYEPIVVGMQKRTTYI